MRKLLPLLFFLVAPLSLLISPAALRYTAFLALFVFQVVFSLKKYDTAALGLDKMIAVYHWPFILASVLLAAFIFAERSFLCPLVTWQGTHHLLDDGPVWLPYLFYILLSAPFQELIYRSFLVNYLEEIGLGSGLVVLVGAVLFAFLHLSWGAALIVGGFLAGLFWGWLFMKTKSFWLLALSHIIVGLAIVFLASSFCKESFIGWH